MLRQAHIPAALVYTPRAERLGGVRFTLSEL